MDDGDLQPLIERHYPRVRRAALALCGDRWEADEVAQETFVIAIQSTGRFRGDSEVSTWLYGICLRVHRNRLRAAARYARRLARLATSRSETDQNKSPDAGPLWAAVRRLPRKQREVVVLRYAEGLSLAEIAAAVDAPEGTVKSRLHHALKTLRERLAAGETATALATRLAAEGAG